MVEKVMVWLEDVRSTQGEIIWLELVETLRTVTEGKIFLETPRARLTLLLAQFHERIANDPSSAPPAKPDPETGKVPPAKTPFESLVAASELMSDLQVETYSSMERKEKTEFILEQMRLLVLVAKEKDREAKVSKENASAEALAGEKKVLAADGEAEWIKVRVGGRKVHEGFLTEKDNQVRS
jgi:26S proteasome regulatory subunit N5